MTIFETIIAIQNTAGSNAKKEILKANMSDTLKLIFEDTYGKQKYYIKKFVPNGMYGERSIDTGYDVFHNVLMKLADRELSGDFAYEVLAKTVSEYDYESQEVLYKIIDRNLKIGISLDNFLDVVGGKESKFEVALAENLNKAKNVDPIDGTYFISRKLDGVRCICYVNKFDEGFGPLVTTVKFMSRQGKQFTTLDNLIHDVTEAMRNFPEGQYVLDGEICIIDDNGNENFHGLMKEVTRKNHTISHPHYNVFDCLTRAEFDGNEISPNFGERLNTMRKRINQTLSLRILEQERVTSQEILDKWVDTAKKNGWEGCMLRKDVPYKRGRSKDLLKIKGMQDAEYVVEDVIFGKAVYNEGGAKEYDIVSALVIHHKGNNVKVGSGLSKEQRLTWFNNPGEIVGKTITVQYFEETQDSKTGEYSLRFPVLKHVYENGREC